MSQARSWRWPPGEGKGVPRVEPERDHLGWQVGWSLCVRQRPRVWNGQDMTKGTSHLCSSSQPHRPGAENTDNPNSRARYLTTLLRPRGHQEQKSLRPTPERAAREGEVCCTHGRDRRVNHGHHSLVPRRMLLPKK